MCGIAGTIRKADSTAERLLAAEEAQGHRGPDGTGRRVTCVGDWEVGLGHQRLAIIDLTEEGAQPLAGPDDDNWIIFNGELYNYLELREELRAEGARFRTATDTEVISVALRRWGIERALTRFNGMWAFAWLDERERKLVLARDRAGEKPLYLHAGDDSFTFASELKGLLAMTGGRFPLDLEVARAFLQQTVIDATPRSMLAGITSLPGGTYLTIDLDRPQLKTEPREYWRPVTTEAEPRSFDDAAIASLAAEVRDLFHDAVRLRLRSDVPVGLLLSGGLDSSAIASAVHAQQGSGDVAMLAAVSNDARFDESPFVDLVAKHLGREVHKVNIDLGPDEAFDLLERVTWHNDEPIGSFTSVAHFKLMEKAKELGVTVVLSGQGADELLCGYKKYMAFYVQKLLKQGRVLAAASMLFDSLRHGTVMRQFNLQEARRYMPWVRESEEASTLGPAIAHLPDHPMGMGDMTMQERQALDLTSLSVPSLNHYEDRMSMAHGREIRLPYLDHRLMDMLLPLPTELKLRDGWTKYIFRKAMEAELPAEITWRKDKQGFSLPQSVWLRGPLRPRILELFEEDAMVFRHGLLDRDRWLAKYDRFSNESEGRGSVWYQEIFNAISMEVWLRRFEEHIAGS